MLAASGAEERAGSAGAGEQPAEGLLEEEGSLGTHGGLASAQG